MPLSDFASNDPDFTPEQEAECARITELLRRVNARAVRLGGSLDALRAAGDRVEALLGALEPVTEARALVTYKVPFDLAAPNDILRFNPATGPFNPLAPSLSMHVEGETLVAMGEFGNAHESGPETAQGGMVAAVYDQVLAYAVMIRGVTGPTLGLQVEYLKPTPINTPLRFEARVTDEDGKKFSVEGVCRKEDQVITRAAATVLGSYELPVAGRPSGESTDA